MPHECTNCGRTFPDGSKEMLSGCPDCGGNKFQFAPAGQATSGGTDSTSSTSGASPAADDAGSTPPGTERSGKPSGTVERAAETVRDLVSSDAEPSDASTAATTGTADPSETTGPTGEPRSNRRDRPDRSWPSNDESADLETTAENEPGTFDEWPETARRPEDRSTPPAEDSGSSGTGGNHPTPDAPDGRESSPRTDATMAESENSAQADARSEVVSTDDIRSGATRRESDTASVEPNASASSVDDGNQHPPGEGRVVSEPSGEQPSIEELREELNEQFESIKILNPGQYELNLMELYNREEYIISLQEDGRYVIDVPDSWRADADEN